MKDALQLHYGYRFEPELLTEITSVGTFKKVDQGQILIDIGETITTMPLLFQGVIKVLREDEQGNELLLYFVEKGDTCAMTFSCCLGTKKSGIRAIAETDTALLLIPVKFLEIWMSKYKTWQRFVLDSYQNRMAELLETVDTLAFLNMDERLLKYLQDKAKVIQDHVLNITHQEIAYDLNTSRVVVSRLLKKLEEDKKIKRYRNHLKVLAL